MVIKNKSIKCIFRIGFRSGFSCSNNLPFKISSKTHHKPKFERKRKRGVNVSKMLKNMEKNDLFSIYGCLLCAIFVTILNLLLKPSVIEIFGLIIFILIFIYIKNEINRHE